MILISDWCSSYMALLCFLGARVVYMHTRGTQSLHFQPTHSTKGNSTYLALSGVLRGAGRQRLAVFSYLLAAYVVGVPLEAWAAFALGLGVAGIWWAQVCVCGCCCLYPNICIMVKICSMGQFLPNSNVDGCDDCLVTVTVNVNGAPHPPFLVFLLQRYADPL